MMLQCFIQLLRYFFGAFYDSVILYFIYNRWHTSLSRNLKIHLVIYQRYVQKQSRMVYVGLSLHLLGVHLAASKIKIYGNMLNFLQEFSMLSCFKTGSR